MERDLEFLGLILFRNEMRPESQQVIADLKVSGVSRDVLMFGAFGVRDCVGKEALCGQRPTCFGCAEKRGSPLHASLCSALCGYAPYLSLAFG